MTDVFHEKFAQLMSEVDELEVQLNEAQKKDSPVDVIAELQDQLADARHRLRQSSDGCGTGRNPGL